jgi:hypothetical protein
MKHVTLKHTLRNLGLTEDAINETFPELQESDDGEEGEVDQSTGDNDTSDLGEIGYLSDDDEDLDEWADDDDDVDDIDLEEAVDNLTDEELDEIAVDAGLDEGFIRMASVSKRKARRKKMKKWLKTSQGRKYMSQKTRKGKTAVAKKKRKIHAKKLAARGGPKKGKIFRENDLQNAFESDVLEDIAELANAMDHDPREQFESFSTAFNGLADLGELAAGSVISEDENVAREFAGVAVGAEAVLREMEKMDGIVTLKDRRMMEATLADAMDNVGTLMAEHNVLDGIDEAFMENASNIVESSRVDQELSIWDSSPLVEDSVLDGIRRLMGIK